MPGTRVAESMTRIMIIIGSVRPGRIGLPIAQWVNDRVTAAGHEVDLVDLVELALPFMDEPEHPGKRAYTKPHTIAWSARVEQADAIVLVSPEYNHSYSPALKNALDFLAHEWQGKPVGVVSYGGASGGLRGAAALDAVLTTIGLVRVPVDVAINGPQAHVVDGVFTPIEKNDAVLARMIDALERYAEVLRPLRA
ncbi:NAD(P)H-dependent oxidoreductase [Microcella sp.]|uniref:NADPH-dependent FMN reductase n=1 Tax=Microcella sp. TaxID=1913979 RepID=UPI00299F769C|nr:NAD(P)H-dependent oxidoreductase [Microcella sp.]MDX2026796.1 NAD(P)H-dependent oxidoreductase [Microcella sp.]